MATDPVVAPARVPARPIKPDLTLWLLSIAHAVNHAQAVLLPLIYLRIITEYGVNLYDVAFPFRHVFTIAHGSIDLQENLIVELIDGEHRGYGEGATLNYYGITPAAIRRDLEAVPRSGAVSRSARTSAAGTSERWSSRSSGRS